MFLNRNNPGQIKAGMDRMTELREQNLASFLEKEEARKAKKLANEEAKETANAAATKDSSEK